MNTGAFGEGFPYSNFHDLNMDWIIKIAKDFLDQYSHIQETIQTGLDDLDSKATELEQLLQEWYDTHSEDIANELANALNSLNAWYAEHEDYLDQTLADNIEEFDTHAEQKASETIASIPDDYTALSNKVTSLEDYTLQVRDVSTLTDLNDAIEPGCYILNSTQAYTNSPMGDNNPIGSNLLVYKPFSGTFILQEFYNNSNQGESYELYRRMYTSNAWNPWVKVYSVKTSVKVNDVSSLSDLNNATQPGHYMLNATQAYLNSPLGDNNPTVSNLIVYTAYTGTSKIQEFYVNTNYGDGFVMYRRMYSGNAWHPWVKVYELKTAIQNRDVSGLTDLNNATQPGFYVLSSQQAYNNSPLGDNNPIGSNLIVYTAYSGSFKMQEFYVNSNLGASYEMYRRMYSSNTWRPWVKVYSLPEFNTVRNETQNTLSETFTPASSVSQGANNGLNLTFMSYNICQFTNDTAVYIPDQKLLNLRKMMMKADADIVAIQEDGAYVDGSTKDSNNYLYYPKYPYRYGTGGNTLHSKIAGNTGDVLMYSNGQTLRYNTFNLPGNVVLLVISTHCAANVEQTGHDSPESIAARAIQYEELFKWATGQIDLVSYNSMEQIHVPTHTHCIIGLDSNSFTSTDKTNIITNATTNNFIASNGGVLGWFFTEFRLNPDNSLDNIFISNNIILNSIEAWSDWYDRLYSDHVPLVAKITLV